MPRSRFANPEHGRSVTAFFPDGSRSPRRLTEERLECLDAAATRNGEKRVSGPSTWELETSCEWWLPTAKAGTAFVQETGLRDVLVVPEERPDVA
jgi:hypothetical protein